MVELVHQQTKQRAQQKVLPEQDLAVSDNHRLERQVHHQNRHHRKHEEQAGALPLPLAYPGAIVAEDDRDHDAEHEERGRRVDGGQQKTDGDEEDGKCQVQPHLQGSTCWRITRNPKHGIMAKTYGKFSKEM